MKWHVINYVLQYDDKKYPLVCTARAIMDNRCLMQSMECIDTEGKHKAHQWLWGEKGDVCPTLCLYVSYCTVTNISSFLSSRAYKYFQEHIYLRNQYWTLSQTNFGLVLRNSTSFRAEREKVNFSSTVGSWISVTSGPWRRPLVSSRSVLGGWRLSQMTLRTELDSLLQVTPSGKLCFHHWLGGSKGRLG